jgi:dipeptidyl aminopeptidase/acylaminoacyl peptidase
LIGCLGGVDVSEVPSDPIAFLRQEQGSISDLEEFGRAVQLVGPVEQNRRKAPFRSTVALLIVPTGEVRLLRDAGPGHYPLDWSPDGLRLLVGRTVGDLIELLEWNRLTGAWDRLTPRFSLGAAAFGSGPIRLASVELPGSVRDRTAASIVVHRDYTTPDSLPGSAGGSDPDVASDGRRVVFVQPDPRAGRDHRVLLAELGGEQPKLIARGTQPRFSHDGQWIVFVRQRRGNTDIWMMRSDGTAKRPLVTSGFDDQFPALSPDGRFVVYASARERGVSQLYMTRLEDGVEVQLTHNGQNGRPVW